MAIYPDKKDGKLTGRFRVELQKGKLRYRKRWDTYAEAQADEAAVLKAWEAGEAPPAPGGAAGAPEVHTIASVVPLARGKLWVGSSTELVNFRHVEIAGEVFGAHKRLDAIDTHCVDAFISHLAKKGKADGTINRHLSHLKTFLTWAKSRGYRTVPVTDIEFSWRKESEGRIRWITAEEQEAMKAFMLAPEQLKRHPDYADVWMLIEVAIETGCRRDELLTATLSQINGNRLHIWRTKSDKPRTVPMEPEVTAKLVSLIQRDAMPSRVVLRTRWKAAQKAIGLEDDKQFVFHTCRHTCATRLVDAGVNVFVIQEWMGHSVLETTLRYAHVKPQNLEEALVRVGERKALMGQKPSISAGFDLPHRSPTGGVKPHFAQAA